MEPFFLALIGICPIVGFWIGYRVFKNIRNKKNK